MDALKSIAGAGSAAVITVSFIHPIDVVKTRMQVSDGKSGVNYRALGMGGSVKTILAQEGVTSFWKGIGAAWMREASYTSLRLGLYAPIKKGMGVTNDSNFLMKFACGSAAGAIGSTAGNPFDVVKTRMMANAGTSPPSLAASFADVYKNRGMAGFYMGLQANVMRAMVLNGTKMGVYDQAKMLLHDNGLVDKKTLAADFCAAGIAGFFMTCTVAPFDKIRTRLMNQSVTEPAYNGFVDCFSKIVKNEGPQALWAGFFPIWSRFAPTTTAQLVIFGMISRQFGINKA